jgi:hypothetical protein
MRQRPPDQSIRSHSDAASAVHPDGRLMGTVEPYVPNSRLMAGSWLPLEARGSKLDASSAEDRRRERGSRATGGWAPSSRRPFTRSLPMCRSLGRLAGQHAVRRAGDGTSISTYVTMCRASSRSRTPACCARTGSGTLCGLGSHVYEKIVISVKGVQRMRRDSAEGQYTRRFSARRIGRWRWGCRQPIGPAADLGLGWERG